MSNTTLSSKQSGCACGKPKNHCDPCSTEQLPSKESLPDWLRRWYALKGEQRFREAADEIERLQRQVAELSTHAEKWVRRALDRPPAGSNDLLDDAQGLICGIVGWLNMQAIENANVRALHAGFRQWLVTYADRAVHEPHPANPTEQELHTEIERLQRENAELLKRNVILSSVPEPPKKAAPICGQCGKNFPPECRSPSCPAHEPQPAASAWLLEIRGGRPLYFGPNRESGYLTDCTYDPNKAVKFQRKEDAESAAEWLRLTNVNRDPDPPRDFVAVEHVWMDRASPEPPAARDTAKEMALMVLCAIQKAHSGVLHPNTARDVQMAIDSLRDTPTKPACNCEGPQKIGPGYHAPYCATMAGTEFAKQYASDETSETQRNPGKVTHDGN